MNVHSEFFFLFCNKHHYRTEYLQLDLVAVNLSDNYLLSHLLACLKAFKLYNSVFVSMGDCIPWEIAVSGFVYLKCSYCLFDNPFA